jgi:hypothetical protein
MTEMVEHCPPSQKFVFVDVHFILFFFDYSMFSQQSDLPRQLPHNQSLLAQPDRAKIFSLEVIKDP